MLVMVSLSAEQWRSIAAEKVLSLLVEEGAVTKSEMEAKLSEAPPQLGLRRPEPHHLTMARNRLLEAGEIVSQRNTTRGGRVVTTFSLAAHKGVCWPSRAPARCGAEATNEPDAGVSSSP